MSNNPKFNGFPNVPPPQGSKAGTAYQRFIPREELGYFASWRPGTFGQAAGDAHAAAQAAASATPPEPTPAEWEARIAAARQAGYQDGYRDGLVALENFKQSFAQQATSQVGALLDSFDEQLTALDAEMSRSLARTAVQLARQVLRTELETRPEVVASVASQAVQAVLFSARQITLQVHPEDLPLVQEGAADALEARGARVVANPALTRGSVVVESDVGSIDARVATRWAQATASLGAARPWDGDAPGGEA